MTDRELDRLLGGAAGVVLTMTNGERLWLDRHDLASPISWRAAMRRQLGHTGYSPPVYCQAEHDAMVRVLFAFVGAVERRAA
jgi:hypothetical protein